MSYNMFCSAGSAKQFAVKLLIAAMLVSALISAPSARQEAERTVPVKTVKASSRNIREIVRFTGTIQPWQRMNIIPATGGKLDRILVEQGDHVDAGDTLAALDIVPVQIQNKQAEAAVSLAKANLEDARMQYYRIVTLKKKGTISSRDFEQARLALRSAEAQLQQAEANLEMAEYNLDEAVMKAPFSGQITGKNAEEGDILSPVPGAPGVVTLIDISSVRIEGSIAAPDIRYIQKGTRAVVHVSTHPDTTFAGVVHSVSPAAEMQTRSFPLEVRVENSGGYLKTGLFARVELIARESESATVVPVDALIEEDGDNYLYVVDNGIARRKKVATGIRENTLMEITAGLAEGDEVILAGNRVVQDGSRVRVERGEGN